MGGPRSGQGLCSGGRRHCGRRGLRTPSRGGLCSPLQAVPPHPWSLRSGRQERPLPVRPAPQWGPPKSRRPLLPVCAQLGIALL